MVRSRRRRRLEPWPSFETAASQPPQDEVLELTMPELPEVETVRRGLEPVMEGARFVRVEMRRPDLRFPFPQNFNKRLEGQSVVGLGRRAKYLLADLTSGEVLLMHLGMSGSFRVVHGSDE